MYVISVKRVKTYAGVDLPEENQYFEYAMIDKYKGKDSTNVACLGRECYAEKFYTIKEAIKWMDENKKVLRKTLHASDYDMSTLAVRKVVFKAVTELTL